MITVLSNSCLKIVILILPHSKFYFDSETQISVEVGVTVTRAHSKTENICECLMSYEQNEVDLVHWFNNLLRFQNQYSKAFVSKSIRLKSFAQLTTELSNSRGKAGFGNGVYKD